MLNHDPNNHRVFTGFEYVLMDIASHWGLDKLTFPERLVWAYTHINELEQIADARGHWKEQPLFMKGVLALRRIQSGQPTGHMVGLDAVNSGMQVLSALIGCERGAKSTGMIDPEIRADAYTDCTDAMRRRIPDLPDNGRQDIKDACMTALYGSQAVPEEIFGNDTPELNAFYESLFEIAPGACRLLGIFKNCWQRFTLQHEWTMPDVHQVQIPVTEMVDTRIEVDELEHTKFSYRYEIIQGTKTGISLIANVTHSVDGWILRSLIRLCNYDLTLCAHADGLLLAELLRREMENIPESSEMLLCPPKDIAGALIYRYQRTGIADISIIEHLDIDRVRGMSLDHIQKLRATLQRMSVHNPFPIVCIHDEFKCSPNDMNHLRMHYREIMAEIAESDLLVDIVSQITGKPWNIRKLSTTLGEKIRQSNYAIC